jgi:hypothetical protein
MNTWQSISLCTVLVALGAALPSAAAEDPTSVPNETPNQVWTSAAAIGAPIIGSVDAPVQAPAVDLAAIGAPVSVEAPVQVPSVDAVIGAPVKVSVEAPAQAPSANLVESPALAPAEITIESRPFAPGDAPASAPIDVPLEMPRFAPNEIKVDSPAFVSPDAPPEEPANVPPASPASPASPSAPTSTLSDLFSRMRSLNLGSLNSEPFARDNRFWATGEYLFSWVNGASYPALATTSPSGTSRSNAGVLGAPGTSTLFGGTLDDNVRPGFRLGAGYWFNDQHTLGVELGFTMLSSQSSLFGATSSGSPILGRPYGDQASGLQQAVLIAYPGSSTGALDFRANSGNFFGGNLDLAERIFNADWLRINAIAGYQAYGYSEGLYAQQTIFPTGTGFIPGTRLDSIDNFSTHNIFHGMDLGLRTEFFWNSLGVELLTKVAIGDLHTNVSATGLTTTAVPGFPAVASPGGVYALLSNMGSNTNNFLTAVPEFGLNLKYQIRPDLQLSLGYSVLWIKGVARVGNEINTTINTNNFPPATNVVPFSQPTFLLNRTDLWVQSINLGLTFTY